MVFAKAQNTAVAERLLHYMQILKGHLKHLHDQEGIVEETLVQESLVELSVVLDDINSLKTPLLIAPARDAVGDACYLLIQLLDSAQTREAIMATFEGVKDAALQSGDASRTHVRKTDKAKLQESIDYYYKARAILAHPADKLELDITILDSGTGFVM
jgi:aromatic ring hydroxylase